MSNLRYEDLEAGYYYEPTYEITESDLSDKPIIG